MLKSSDIKVFVGIQIKWSNTFHFLKYSIDRNGISSIKLEGASRSFANAFLYFKIKSLFFQTIKKQTAISAAMNYLT